MCALASLAAITGFGMTQSAAGDVVGRRDPERHVVRVEHLRPHLREVDRVHARIGALRVVGVLAHPARRVVPGVVGQREPLGAGMQQQVARRRIRVVGELEHDPRADVDIAVDEHAPSIVCAEAFGKRAFQLEVMKKFDRDMAGVTLGTRGVSLGTPGVWPGTCRARPQA